MVIIITIYNKKFLKKEVCAMNYNDGGLSASDVALLTGNRNNCNEGFGDGTGAW